MVTEGTNKNEETDHKKDGIVTWTTGWRREDKNNLGLFKEYGKRQKLVNKWVNTTSFHLPVERAIDDKKSADHQPHNIIKVNVEDGKIESEVDERFKDAIKEVYSCYCSCDLNRRITK